MRDLRFDSNALAGLEESLAGLARGIVNIEANVVAQVVRE